MPSPSSNDPERTPCRRSLTRSSARATTWTCTPSQAEEHYGLRFAREALELDPTYRPAQVIFLSIALDKGVERAGLDQPLAKGALPLRELLTSVNPGLVIAVLDKALQEHRL